MADLARFSALFIILCSSPGTLSEPPFFARERETFWYLFCPRTPYGSRVSLIGEERKKERRQKMTIFDFFQNSLCVTVSGKTTLLAEIEKVGFLLPMDSINTRLCCGTSS